MRRLALTAGLIALLTCCNRNIQLDVKHVAQPDYPLQARSENIQGAVEVEVGIGTDGTVISASGSGGNWILREAAEKNASQWVFGPFPRVAAFPMYRTITYVYKLEGKPIFVAHPPRVRTFLPDRVEIVASPLASDYGPIIEDKKSTIKK
jgi:TonB family protein